ncbi:MAG TPA: phosphatase PAP2 family protein [Xanthobacteraceae bacterium]
MSMMRDRVERTAAPGGPVMGRMLAHLGAWLALIVRPPFARADGAGGRAGPRWSFLALVGLGAIAVIGGAMALFDAWAIAQQRNFPAWVVQVFERITNFGKSGWFLWPAGLLVIAAAALARPALGRGANLVILSLVVRLEFVFLAIGIPGLMVSIVKRLIGRVRPSDWGPFHYVPFSWRPDYAALPSGHSTAAFAAAFAIGAIWPRARVSMWIFAGVIAVSRVAVHAHFPSDVIAGAFVGIFGAILVRNWFAARRLAFVRGTDGKVRALAGPSARRIRSLAARLAGR